MKARRILHVGMGRMEPDSGGAALALSGHEGRGLRDMKLFCSNTLPAGTKVRQTFDMIVHTGEVSLSSHRSGTIDERSEAVRREFVALAPKEANAVIGVQIATDVVLYDIGGGALYLTYLGNPAVIEET